MQIKLLDQKQKVSSAFSNIYNHSISQRALKHQTSIQVLKE